MQTFRKIAKYALVRESTMTAEMSEETVDIVVGRSVPKANRACVLQALVHSDTSVFLCYHQADNVDVSQVTAVDKHQPDMEKASQARRFSQPALKLLHFFSIPVVLSYCSAP